MTIGASGASARPDPSLVVELLARRWREGRPYFTLRERIEGAGLHAFWRRRPGPRGLASVLVALESSQRCDRQLAACKLASPVAREEYVDRAAHGTIHGLGLYRRQYAEEHALQQL